MWVLEEVVVVDEGRGTGGDEKSWDFRDPVLYMEGVTG